MRSTLTNSPPPRMALEYNAKNLMTQVCAEVKLSRDTVKPKREEFKERLRLYNNQKRQKDRIGINTIFYILNTLLAVNYMDEINVGFDGRGKGDDRKAENLEKLAKFDYDEMDLEELDYFHLWDKFFFGVSLRYMGAWDKRRKVPIPRRFTPLLWLPDPYGYGKSKNYRWHGFEDMRTKSEMKESMGYDRNAVRMLGAPKGNSEQEQYMRQVSEDSGYSPQAEMSEEMDNKLYPIIHHYTTFQGAPVLVTMNEDCDKVLRFQEIVAVTSEEKEFPDRIPFGVVTTSYSPKEFDPFGVSLPDLIEDKQRYKSVLANLRLLQEKARLFPGYFYNKDRVRNRRDLDLAFNKFIAVSGPVGDDIVRPIPRDVNTAHSINHEQSIDAEVQITTGIDQIMSGVMSSQSRTLGEVQQVTANSNIRQLLGTKLNSWGDKEFWKLWHRTYKRFFNGSDVKTIRVTNARGTKFMDLKGKDFFTKENPDIVIKSKFDSDQKREKSRVAFTQAYGVIAADPNVPQSSKMYSLRKVLKLTGIESDEVELMVPYSPDETNARMENELLDRNEVVDIRETDDHLTHNLAHEEADDTPAKFAHMQAHSMAYMLLGQKAKDEAMRMMAMQQNGGQKNANANQAMAQIGNQAMQQGASKVDNISPSPV